MSTDGVVKIHGKQYRTVARRVADFRAKHPPSSGWAIDTKIEQLVDGSAIVRATILDPEGRAISTALAQDAAGDSSRHKTSWLEIAETSAVGRALAFFSLETMGDEFSIASAEEVQNVRESEAQLEKVKAELVEFAEWAPVELIEKARVIARHGGGSLKSFESALDFMKREAPRVIEEGLEEMLVYFGNEAYDQVDQELIESERLEDRAKALQTLKTVQALIETGEKR